MSKLKTDLKIMRVDYQAFKRLEEKNINHNKTFKIRKDEKVNKIYFISFDDEGNLHYIGKNSKYGFIDKIALMREISDGQDSNQINAQLIALIDQESKDNIPRLLYLVGFLFVLSAVIVTVMALISLCMVPIFPASPAAVPFIISSLLILGAPSIGGLYKIFDTLNTTSNFRKFYIPASGIALGASLGASVGTIIAPGIGTLIGAVIGAVVSFTAVTALVVYDHVRKKADNPLIIKHILESITINDPIGSPVKVKELEFSTKKSRHYYGDYRDQYKKLFPSIKTKEKASEDSQNENIIQLNG